MNKKVLNTTTATTQKSNEQKQTKTLIINLGTATQLTLGGGGSIREGGPRAWDPPH